MEQPTGTPTTPAGVVACADRVLAEKLRAHLAAVEASVLAEVHARGVAKGELAWGSTAEWFTHLAGTHRGSGHQTIRHADTLVNERSATHAAMVAGRVSPEQAAVIVDAIDRLPTDATVRQDGEAFLLEQASRLNATDLAKAARHLVEVADPDAAERKAERELDRQDRAAHHGRFLAIVEDGAAIKAALLPLTKPAPAVDPRDPGGEQLTDPRDHGARLWDALVETCRHALTTDLPPDCHGARPRIAVTTSLEVLRQQIDWATLGAGTSTTDDGLELTPAVVRRMACDADLLPIALGTKGEVLDVGCTSRLVTPAIWRALVCRDRHCAFPGCTRPPVMGHAHHITHWADHGNTSLENLVLLCGQHHRTLHHTPWQVRINPADGKPEFLPPPRPGAPPPTWLRTRRRE